MCGGINRESIVSEIVISVVKNEKFFDNMKTEEKIKAVSDLYKTLYHEIVVHGCEHDQEHGYGHNHEHIHEHSHGHNHD